MLSPVAVAKRRPVHRIRPSPWRACARASTRTRGPARNPSVGASSLAAAAAGADGIIVEVHPAPEEAICDGPQQLRTEGFAAYARKVEAAAAVAGKAAFIAAAATA